MYRHRFRLALHRPTHLATRLPYALRPLSTTPVSLSSSPHTSSPPGPPRLPPDQQREYEELVRAQSGASSPPSAGPAPTRAEEQPSGQKPASGADFTLRHPDARPALAPEFQGDRNPATGEIGGPKNDPLRWGSNVQRGDWSFGGRVSDF